MNTDNYVDPRSSADFPRALAILADRVETLIGYVVLLRREAECLRAVAAAEAPALGTKARAGSRNAPALMFRFPSALIEQCGHTKTAAYRALALGQIDTVKIGKARFVTAKALGEYVALLERLSSKRGGA